ncbi:UPF0721 transmembrane protein [Alicyclobacillus cellulosilyticus]|uniref:Probable membrane transporter protein n=1 Tax=Alicyclobacillus cellulosilyticus TaxID=1003997 RepID=A0A917K976_9BACL|nr:TSUP family transporter [Alicyclobacillus cellulosilyticus]GGJ05457.1 UPF0721 transmembrane protein [Alicyclobacillus cellulosilyticus]
MHVHLVPFHLSILLLAFGLAAGFVDAAVGGGGLIAVPGLLFVGLPPALALGTNKFGGTLGAVTSAVSYAVSGRVHRRMALTLAPLSLAGSVLGALLVHHLPSGFLKPLVLVLLVAVTAYTAIRKDAGRVARYQGLSVRARWLLPPAALGIGFYDGFFGPGTGSFLIMVFLLTGFDFVTASGNAKVLNLASNLGALCTFFALHAVDYAAGAVLAAAMMAGAAAGSQVAIRKGAAYLRPLFIGMTSLLVLHQAWVWWAARG